MPIAGDALSKGWRATLVSMAAACALLAGCGGGSLPGLDSDDDLFDWFHGAIAVNPDNLAIAITANQPSQDTADAQAVEACGGEPCIVVLRYSGKDSCAAIARAGNGKYGIGEGASRSNAMTKALNDCQAQGGKDCEPGLAECND
jgi:Domain of unknown function (DUF4189)